MKFGSKQQSKKGLIVAIVVLAVVLLVVAAIVLTKKSNTTSTTPTTDTSKNTTVKDTATETDTTDTAPQTAPSDTSVDPETLTSVDVEPLGVTVFYSKGTPGFEYSVQRAADKTQYVEFTSPDLVGTKCTNDTGSFVSIIKNPSTNEAQTISQTVKVGSDTYGLSLASPGCTGDQALLSQYQAGFKNGFSSLKAL